MFQPSAYSETDLNYGAVDPQKHPRIAAHVAKMKKLKRGSPAWRWHFAAIKRLQAQHARRGGGRPGRVGRALLTGGGSELVRGFRRGFGDDDDEYGAVGDGLRREIARAKKRLARKRRGTPAWKANNRLLARLNARLRKVMARRGAPVVPRSSPHVRPSDPSRTVGGGSSVDAAEAVAEEAMTHVSPGGGGDDDDPDLAVSASLDVDVGDDLTPIYKRPLVIGAIIIGAIGIWQRARIMRMFSSAAAPAAKVA